MTNGPPFWGKFRGIVSDTNDPLFLGRIKARVPDVYGDNESGWAQPCAPFGGGQTGFFALPVVGAQVWIEFEHGDRDYPIWTGARWTSSERPSSLQPQASKKVLIQTEGGNKITLDDSPGQGGITIETSGGQKIKLTQQGIEIDNGQGGKISLQSTTVKVNDGALEVM